MAATCSALYFMFLAPPPPDNPGSDATYREIGISPGGYSPAARKTGSGTLHNGSLWKNFSSRRQQEKSAHILIAILYCSFIVFNINT